MDRDFLEKRKKDLNAYLQVMINALIVSFMFSVVVFVVCLTVRVFVSVAAKPRDGEGLSKSDPLRLRLPREQGLQQGKRRIRTEGLYIYFAK